MKKILVIDDEPAVCRVIKNGLEESGEFEVSICTNSQEAFEKARSLLPDLIFVDVKMPKLSGPQVVEQLENDEVTHIIPYVYLTGAAADSEVLEREDVIGGSKFLAKPIRISELLRVIHLVLGS